MTAFVLNRLLWFVPTLLAIYTISFLMVHYAPGDPFSDDRNISAETLAEHRRIHGLDRPLHEQYVRTLVNLVTLRGMPSMKYPERNVISDLLVPTFPTSFALGLTSLTVATLLGLAVGTYSAVRRYSLLDHLFTGVTLLGVSLPSFVIAALLLMVFGFHLGVLPAFGWGTPAQLVLPVISLAAFPAAYIARLTRNSMVDVLPLDFIRVARAKGVPGGQVIILHALRNAFLPVLSYLGPAAASIFTGSFVIENVFRINGVGHHFVQGALNRDYPLILACVMLFSALLVLMNLLVDIGYALLDPRIKYD